MVMAGLTVCSSLSLLIVTDDHVLRLMNPFSYRQRVCPAHDAEISLTPFMPVPQSYQLMRLSIDLSLSCSRLGLNLMPRTTMIVTITVYTGKVMEQIFRRLRNVSIKQQSNMAR